MLKPGPLTRERFADYGDVISADESRSFLINDGSTTRFHDLARVEATGSGATVLINLFRARPLDLPLAITMMECHPFGSQCFMPLNRERFLVVVAARGDDVAPEDLEAFVTDGWQGVNFAPGVWHHPVIALEQQTDFLVVDRGGPGENLAVVRFSAGGSHAVLLPPEQDGRNRVVPSG